MEPADIVFITHSHSDHCSLADLVKIIKEGSVVVPGSLLSNFLSNVYDGTVFLELENESHSQSSVGLCVARMVSDSTPHSKEKWIVFMW